MSRRPRNFMNEYGSTVTGRLYHEKPVVEEVDAGTLLFGDFSRADFTAIEERIMAHQSSDEFRRAHHVEKKYYRHKKRGGLYEIVGRAAMQIGETTIVLPIAQELERMTFIVYRHVATDTLWVRPEREFFDGRFEEVWQ